MKTRPLNRRPPGKAPHPRVRHRSDWVVRLLALAGCLAGPAGSAVFAAEQPVQLGVPAVVTRINDGDSIEVDLAAGPGRVRFAAIDTPEYDQPYGDKSSAALKAMLPVGSKVELDVIT